MKDRDIHVRLSEETFKHLEKVSKKSNLTKSEYLRQGIGPIRESYKPSPELINLLKEINAIGNNLNQLVVIARTKYYMEDKIEEAIKDINEMRRKVLEIL